MKTNNMKHLSFLFVLSVLSLAVSAQYKSHVEFGLKAGLNIADLSMKGGNDSKAKVSFNAGGLAHIHFSQHFALQPELVFSGQGAQSKDDDDKLNLSYLNIPVLLQYMTGSGFRIQTGPQLGFLLAAKAKSGGETADVKDAFKTTDFSWAFGLSYVTPSGFGVDGRYNLGISDISKGNDEGKVRNSVFQFGVFYQFKNK